MRPGLPVRALAAAALVVAGASACAPAATVDGTATYAEAATGTAASPTKAATVDPLAALRATDWPDFAGYVDLSAGSGTYALSGGRATAGLYVRTLLRTQQYGTYAGHPVALVVVDAHRPSDLTDVVEEYLFTADTAGTVRLLAGIDVPTAVVGASMADSDYWCHAAFRLSTQGVGEFHNDCAQGYQGPYLGRTLVLGPPAAGHGATDSGGALLTLVPLGAAVPIPGNPPRGTDGGLTTWNGRGNPVDTVNTPNPDVSAPAGG